MTAVTLLGSTVAGHFNYFSGSMWLGNVFPSVLLLKFRRIRLIGT